MSMQLTVSTAISTLAMAILLIVANALPHAAGIPAGTMVKEPIAPVAVP